MSFAEGTPTVDLQLGGNTYTLGWTWGSKRRLKEKLEAQGSSLSDTSAITENLPAVLWASLDKETRDSMSVEDLEELVNPANEAEVIEKIGSLFAKSEPDPDPKENPVAGKTPTTGRQTSTSSPQLASTT